MAIFTLEERPKSRISRCSKAPLSLENISWKGDRRHALACRMFQLASSTLSWRRVRLCSYSLAVLCRTDGQTLLLVAILSLPDFSLLVRAEEVARQESASRISGYGFCNDLGHGRHQTPPRMRSDRRPVSESPADCPGRPRTGVH